MKKLPKKPQIAIYQVLGDEQKIRVRIEDENVWLTQKLISVRPEKGVLTPVNFFERVFDEVRTYFKKRYANSIIETTDIAISDSSGDIAAAGRPAPTVLPRTTTNNEDLKQETKKTDFNLNRGVIYQAESGQIRAGLTPPGPP